MAVECWSESLYGGRAMNASVILLCCIKRAFDRAWNCTRQLKRYCILSCFILTEQFFHSTSNFLTDLGQAWYTWQKTRLLSNYQTKSPRPGKRLQVLEQVILASISASYRRIPPSLELPSIRVGLIEKPLWSLEDPDPKKSKAADPKKPNRFSIFALSVSKIPSILEHLQVTLTGTHPHPPRLSSSKALDWKSREGNVKCFWKEISKLTLNTCFLCTASNQRKIYKNQSTRNVHDMSWPHDVPIKPSVMKLTSALGARLRVLSSNTATLAPKSYVSSSTFQVKTWSDMGPL